MPAVLNLILIADNDEFLTILLPSLSACFKVGLYLPALVRVKVEEIIDFVSPLGVIGIMRENFVGPLSRLNNLSLLNVIDDGIWLLSIGLVLPTNLLHNHRVSFLETKIAHHRLQNLAL